MAIAARSNMPGGGSGERRSAEDNVEQIQIQGWLRIADEMVRGARRKGGTDGRKGGEPAEPGRKPSGDRRGAED